MLWGKKGIEILDKLEPITLERVQALHKLPAGQTRRKCFETHSGIQDTKQRPSFSVNFRESIKPLYEAAMMGKFRLQYSEKYGNYWHFINGNEIEDVRGWERAQGSRVFIRDTLSTSIALAEYSSDPSEHQRTPIGELVYQAKYQVNQEAIQALSGRMAETIRSLPYYRIAHGVCAVPPCPTKTRTDLPTQIAALVAKELGVDDLTAGFQYQGTKAELKGLPLEQKWPALEAAGITYAGGRLDGKKIILIDDLYQSGVTMQFIAMKLQDAGAHHVYGLSMAKNLSDTDNQ